MCMRACVRADRERILREKIRLHTEHMRDRHSHPADNPADEMRSAQRELEIVSPLILLTAQQLSSDWPIPVLLCALQAVILLGECLSLDSKWRGDSGQGSTSDDWLRNLQRCLFIK